MKKFGKALKLALINWKTMLKSVVVQLALFAAVIALVMLAFSGVYAAAVELVESLDLTSFAGLTFEELIRGTINDETILTEVLALVRDVVEKIEAIPNFFNAVSVSYVLALVLLFVYRVLVGCTDVAVMSQITDFMTNNTFRHFSWHFFKTFPLSVKFLLLQFAVTIGLDATILFAAIGVFMLCTISLKGYALLVSLAVVLVLYALRQTLFAFWLPCVVIDGKRPAHALSKALSAIPSKFWSVFWKYLLTITLASASSISASCLIYYTGSPYWSLLGGFLAFVFFFINKCVGALEYYESEQKPYFTVKLKLPAANELRLSDTDNVL